MPRVAVAHDFTCSWCWIGLSQAKRLRQEFGVEIEWLPYEAYPEGYPGTRPAERSEPDRPPIPSRFELGLAAEGLEPPPGDPPGGVRTRAAHIAVELAKQAGCADILVERLYRAYWVHGLDLSSLEVLELLSRGLPIEAGRLRQAVADPAFADRVVQFDEPAHRTGVHHLPTFAIGETRLAEQPYGVLRRAVAEWLGREPTSPTGPYGSLTFPAAPAERPYVAINMVTTIDGKSVTGERDEGVMDLGSAVDHDALRQIEHAAQAVMIGAATLRATPKIRYPAHLFRFVVSRSGAVDPASDFFGERGYVVLPGATPSPLAEERTLRFGADEVDLREVLAALRQRLGIETLVVEGGSELNARLISLGLVDELFLTLAPKVKLGRDTPTYAGGEPLPRRLVQRFTLVEHHRIGNEVFLRYRRPDELGPGDV